MNISLLITPELARDEALLRATLAILRETHPLTKRERGPLETDYLERTGKSRLRMTIAQRLASLSREEIAQENLNKL